MENNKGTILIADDKQITREMLTGLLEAGSFNCLIEEYKSGNALEEKLKRELANSDNVRLLITDKDMPPGPTGSELIQMYAPLVKFPIILHYGGNRSIGEKAVKDGAFDYLIKSLYGFNQFIELVGKALKNSK